uniref:Uncharacterized protein n=1 Tax=Ascaris lumbricoides TaxID=6252 RepID=A0A0M3IFL2_ASCLU
MQIIEQRLTKCVLIFCDHFAKLYELCPSRIIILHYTIIERLSQL